LNAASISAQAGHQLVLLSLASASTHGGGLRQVVSVTPGLVRFGIWIAADQRSPGVMGRIQVKLHLCGDTVTPECLSSDAGVEPHTTRTRRPATLPTPVGGG
jgi:hypothetical protein